MNGWKLYKKISLSELAWNTLPCSVPLGAGRANIMNYDQIDKISSCRYES
jgi:hypothetical protein